MNPPYTVLFSSMTESPGSRWLDLLCRSSQGVINISHKSLLAWNWILGCLLQHHGATATFQGLYYATVRQARSNLCRRIIICLSFDSLQLKYHPPSPATMANSITRSLLHELGNNSTEHPVEADGFIWGNNFSSGEILRQHGLLCACKRVHGYTYITTTFACQYRFIHTQVETLEH